VNASVAGGADQNDIGHPFSQAKLANRLVIPGAARNESGLEGQPMLAAKIGGIRGNPERAQPWAYIQRPLHRYDRAPWLRLSCTAPGSEPSTVQMDFIAISARHFRLRSRQ
jgi:hypothetical protein